MKVLKSVLIACSLCAAVAHAQSPAPAADAQQLAQASVQQPDAQPQRGFAAVSRVAAPLKKADDCVGPAGFCTIYFGS